MYIMCMYALCITCIKVAIVYSVTVKLIIFIVHTVWLLIYLCLYAWIIDCISVALIYCGKGKVIVLVTAFYLLEIVIFSGLPSTVIGFCCGRITFVISCIHCSKMLSSAAVGLHSITGILLSAQYLTSLKI